MKSRRRVAGVAHVARLAVPERLLLLAGLMVCASYTSAETSLPIADAHVHYSHDSVEMSPPERVIELMRSANLAFALVSSSDDNGTQLLFDLAPDLIIPGLRPYRRRGELNSWFRDPAALAYVEDLLAKNRYASIGEFHLYGADADLPIPRRIVELAAQYNLVLHAHSDADAVERLLAQNESVKVLWAHSGFDSPEDIATMLAKHDRLWADLAFRSEVGSGGSLSNAWQKLFTDFPDRLMLGTDTYTPERMYFIPEHAEAARIWLASLPAQLAENIAWKNAHELLMPVWDANRSTGQADVHNGDGDGNGNGNGSADTDAKAMAAEPLCHSASVAGDVVLGNDKVTISLQPLTDTLQVSEAFSLLLTICGNTEQLTDVKLNALMPAHGHGMNYQPEYTVIESDETGTRYRVDGLLLHMPGQWQWSVTLEAAEWSDVLTYDFTLN